MPERPLHAVRNRDLVISQLLTPQAFLLPVGLAFVVVQAVLEGSWSFIGVASTITAMAGVLLQPVRRVLQDWDFRLARDPAAGCGCATACWRPRSQTVPLHRVQTVAVDLAAALAVKGWLRLRLDVAGYAGAGGATTATGPTGCCRWATCRPRARWSREVLPERRPAGAGDDPAAGPGPLAAPVALCAFWAPGCRRGCSSPGAGC